MFQCSTWPPALGTALGATVSAWQCHSAAQPEVVALNNRMELWSSAAAQVTQLQTRVWQKQERGGAGGAQPPLNCQLISMPLFITGCKDQNGSEMVAQEQF